ncbi:LCP family protein [Microbacterium helvum]|uniref:LCP family protein n=1 Tax=Microbacterium helvum TaxID=2773713 RepID=UPI00296524CC|nr:LCP family protein [Microbacterium helvum]
MLQTRHPLVSILAMLGVVLGVVAVSATGITAYNVWAAAQTVVDNAVVLDADKPLPPSLDAIEGGVNLLMVGTDSCEGENAKLSTACMAGDTDGERNDVTMLVHISDEPRRVTVVSFPRDMLEPIPSCPKEDGSGNYSAMASQKLNVSYSYGGLTCTVMTIEAITKQEIDFAAAIRWSGVIAMSDAIGGVDVCIGEGGISDPEHTGLTLSEGEHTLQGWEALQFLRIRHGIGNGSDLGRISNQQQFMSSMVRKLQSDAVLADPARLLTLATTAIGQMQKGELKLSSGLANPTLMVQIAMAVKNVPFEDIVFVQYPTRYSDDALRVYPVTEAADQLFAALEANEPLTLTGDPSQGGGVEVTGEVVQPEPTTEATPTPGASPGTDATTDPQQRVELPSDIAGQTADQTTCTVREGK